MSRWICNRQRTALLVGVALLVASSMAFALGPRGPKKLPKPDPKGADAMARYLKCAVQNDAACMDQVLEELGKLRGACSFVMDSMHSCPDDQRVVVTRAAIKLKCDGAVTVALEFLQSDECFVKGELMQELAPTKDPALAAPVGELVRKGRPFEREMGCKVLAALGVTESIPALIAATTASMFSVRLAAAEALAAFKTQESQDALCGLLKGDSNSGVRIKAAASLGALKRKESVPCLIEGLKDANANVQSATHDALVAVTGMDLGISDEPWSQWWEKNKPTGRRR